MDFAAIYNDNNNRNNKIQNTLNHTDGCNTKWFKKMKAGKQKDIL